MNSSSSVKLISHTSFVDQNLGDTKTLDLQDLIAFCARVSNPANQTNTKTSDRLIRYLIDHKHWSPFEMVDVTLEINTTRDIGRQILRHISMRFQEFSQRYADPTVLEFQIREARLQDPKNRQNSFETNDSKLQDEWSKRQIEVITKAQEHYRWALEHGIAKEQARALLPEGLTMSRMYVKGSIRSWIHYIDLRSDEGTQKEHREIAQSCAKVISKVFPLIKEFEH